MSRRGERRAERYRQHSGWSGSGVVPAGEIDALCRALRGVSTSAAETSRALDAVEVQP